ncbi:JAB domain-containing protein [Streptomyces murinus]|uniref:JAB domain-containing protein n=1 Tax=Streptomyces murinus TaxID=33900 RepID=UPI0037268829
MGMRMREVPAQDRPRERLLDRGAEALSDRELLALLLGAGLVGQDAVELAGRLIAQHGGLYALSRVPAHELVASLPGVGPAKAARVAAAFQLGRRAAVQQAPARRVSGSADLAAVASPLLRGLRHERAVLVTCDGAGAVVHASVLTDGASDRTLVPIRDTLARVLALGGVAFGVAHNHPTGRLTPSEADRLTTSRLAAGAEAVGLRFLDHVVVTDEGWRRVPPD